MALDIKEIISNVVEKIKNDGNIKESFEKDPVKTIERIIGVDLPDDIADGVISGIKTKIGADGISDALEGLGSLFGKK